MVQHSHIVLDASPGEVLRMPWTYIVALPMYRGIDVTTVFGPLV